MTRGANEVISVAEVEVRRGERWLHLRVPLPKARVIFLVLAFIVLALSVRLGWLDLVTIQVLLTMLAKLLSV